MHERTFIGAGILIPDSRSDLFFSPEDRFKVLPSIIKQQQQKGLSG